MATGEKINYVTPDTNINGAVRKTWDLKTDGQDRIGFRVPKSMGEYKYAQIRTSEPEQ